ncbi:MAG TPA: YciI family protein [Acidobacteriaceae bacterium]|jgi:hypothetical protein
MPQFLVAIHHPDNFDPSMVDQTTMHDIHELNKEMIAAGIRVFVGGLESARNAKSIRLRPGGEAVLTDGPYLEAKEHVGGFWVLECKDLDDALAWGRKAAAACRASVEVRAFHPPLAK